MAGYKKTKIVPFQTWETRNSDGTEKRYFRLGATLMASEQMRTLSGNAFKVLCYMKIESAGRRSFTFSYSKYKSYMTRPTFNKVLKELESHGFIEVVQHNKNLRKANIYMFSDKWKNL